MQGPEMCQHIRELSSVLTNSGAVSTVQIRALEMDLRLVLNSAHLPVLHCPDPTHAESPQGRMRMSPKHFILFCGYYVHGVCCTQPSLTPLSCYVSTLRPVQIGPKLPALVPNTKPSSSSSATTCTESAVLSLFSLTMSLAGLPWLLGERQWFTTPSFAWDTAPCIDALREGEGGGGGGGGGGKARQSRDQACGGKQTGDAMSLDVLEPMPPELTGFVFVAASVSSYNALGLDLVAVLERRLLRRVWHHSAALPPQFNGPSSGIKREVQRSRVWRGGGDM
eukprot:1357746-Rhodomonas_salina.1